jgi:hypothetical protein
MAQLWPVHKAECQRLQAANEEKTRSLITIYEPTDFTPAP